MAAETRPALCHPALCTWSWNSPRFRETIGNKERGGERKGEHGRECTASPGNVSAYPSHTLSVSITKSTREKLKTKLKLKRVVLPSSCRRLQQERPPPPPQSLHPFVLSPQRAVLMPALLLLLPILPKKIKIKVTKCLPVSLRATTF